MFQCLDREQRRNGENPIGESADRRKVGESLNSKCALPVVALVEQYLLQRSVQNVSSVYGP